MYEVTNKYTDNGKVFAKYIYDMEKKTIKFYKYLGKRKWEKISKRKFEKLLEQHGIVKDEIGYPKSLIKEPFVFR